VGTMGCTNSGLHCTNNGLLIGPTGVAARNPNRETIRIEPSLGEVDAFQSGERAAGVGRAQHRVVTKSGFVVIEDLVACLQKDLGFVLAPAAR